jgi:hypothetical protein
MLLPVHAVVLVAVEQIDCISFFRSEFLFFLRNNWVRDWERLSEGIVDLASNGANSNCPMQTNVLYHDNQFIEKGKL